MHKAPKGTNSTTKVGGTTGPQGRSTFLKNMFFEIWPVFVCFRQFLGWFAGSLGLSLEIEVKGLGTDVLTPVA